MNAELMLNTHEVYDGRRGGKLRTYDRENEIEIARVNVFSISNSIFFMRLRQHLTDTKTLLKEFELFFFVISCQLTHAAGILLPREQINLVSFIYLCS